MSEIANGPTTTTTTRCWEGNCDTRLPKTAAAVDCFNCLKLFFVVAYLMLLLLLLFVSFDCGAAFD